jgi:hypothetical protein
MEGGREAGTARPLAHRAIPQRSCVPVEPAASPGALTLQTARSSTGLLRDSNTTFLLLPRCFDRRKDFQFNETVRDPGPGKVGDNPRAPGTDARTYLTLRLQMRSEWLHEARALTRPRKPSRL